MATSHLDSMLLSSARGIENEDAAGYCATVHMDSIQPVYMEHQSFIDFLNRIGAVEQDYGYMALLFDKDVYQPGDLVQGSCFVELFKDAYQKDIFIQFKGYQKVSPAKVRLIN